MTPARAALAVAALLALGCSTPPGEPPRSDATPPDRRAQIREMHLPNIPLITHEGRRVRFYDDLVRDKIVAINFMFATCRAACPQTTRNLVAVQQMLGERAGRDITLLSITLDPERDTPEVLRGYAEAHHAHPGWIFLTGERDDIELLRHKLGVYDRDPVIDADPKQHAGLVVLGNEPRGRWRAITSLVHPVRIRQAMDRVILRPDQWPTGQQVVDEVPYEESVESLKRVGPPDLASLPVLD